MLARAIPLAILAASFGIGISYFNPNNQPDDANIMPFLIPCVFGLVALGLYLGVSRQKVLFESYCLTISDMQIVREQKNTPTIVLPLSHVSQIIKNSNGSFTIKGKTKLDVIGVPAQIDNYGNLETSLHQICPLTTQTVEPLTQKLNFAIVVAMLGLMACVYLASNKIIVGISGTILSAVLIYSFIQIQRNKNIDSKTKRSSYTTILVLLSVIAITIYKLMA